MAIETNLQVFYPLSADVNDAWNSDNGTNSGMTFGTHGGVVSADIHPPANGSVPNSAHNFSFGTGDFTMCAWVNPDVVMYGAANQGSIWSTGNGNYDFAIYEGKFYMFMGGTGNVRGTSTAVVSTGTWQHLAIVRSGTTVTLYYNGVEPASGTTGSPGTANITSSGTPSLLIGNAPGVANAQYNGKACDLAMWNRALSATEIADIHSAGAGNFNTLLPLSGQLQAYWECNDASDTMGNHPATFNTVSVGSGTGKFGDSWDFASIASCASLATPTPNTANMTAMAWGYNLRSGSTNWRSLFFNGAAVAADQVVQFVITGSTELAGVWSNSAFTSTGTTLASGSYTGWHHYAVVKNGSTVTLYVDGVSVGSITPTWTATTAIAEIGGRITGASTQGFAERLDDVAVWTRPLTTAEINQIYSAGAPLSSLIPGPAILKGMFGSLVHDAPPDVAVLEGMFGSLVHDAPPNVAKLEGMFGSLVHDAPPDVAVLEGMFGSLVHDIPSPTAIVPDISGPPLVPATFDGSASIMTTYYHWSWVSVPGGSTVANAPIPFPDGGATTPIDMTGNLGLWHFDTLNTVSTPTGSVGLIDTYGDGWQAGNALSVAVGGVTVLSNITLPSGAGPLWFDYAASPGVAVSVTFTAGSWSSECKYDLNDAAGGTGTTFYNSGTSPTVPYNFTAGTFASATSYNTPDTSGGSRTLQVHGATQAVGKVGTHCLSLDGVDDYLIYEAADVFPGTTNAITVSLWQYGGTSMPMNSTLLCAQDASNNRVFNLHLPWSNSNVYWDCGNTGATYDRINKLATTGDFKGAWNHWVFTKDVSTGTMAIYLNGVLWHSGTGKNLTLGTVTKFYVGTHTMHSATFYDGKIDELAVWSRVLSADEIATIYAAQNGALAGVGTSTFTFTPDIVGTYTINLAIDASTNTNADAVIAVPSAGGGSGTQGNLLQGNKLQGGNVQGDF
tara:strand:+ start:13032 stop:15893 length:2862 start_codon:yes stop_codon:yes gene_type:complete